MTFWPHKNYLVTKTSRLLWFTPRSSTAVQKLYVVHWIVCNNITDTETITGEPNIYGLFYPIYNADRQLADKIDNQSPWMRLETYQYFSNRLISNATYAPGGQYCTWSNKYGLLGKELGNDTYIVINKSRESFRVFGFYSPLSRWCFSINSFNDLGSKCKSRSMGNFIGPFTDFNSDNEK